MYKREKMKKLKLLDIFSGIGGFSLGLEKSGFFETIAFCENDKHCRKVLDKHWPDVQKFSDIRDISLTHIFDGEDYLHEHDGKTGEIKTEVFASDIDIIAGGFPCVDISVAGKKRGLYDQKVFDKHIAAGFSEEEAKDKSQTRSGLWTEYCRLIHKLQPRWVIIENVDRLVTHGLEEVLNDLAKIRYDAEWAVIQASHIGAKHKRSRVWIVAYPREQRCDGSDRNEGQIQVDEKRNNSHLSEEWEQCKSESGPHGKIFSERFMQAIEDSYAHKWATFPNILRVVDGLSKGMDRSRQQRIKQLGNAIVPQIAEMIGREIIKYENEKKINIKGKMNGISLFTGYAGIDIAISEYVRPILYCEIEKYAQAILLSRMDDESIPFAPIWNDVTTLDGTKFRGMVDIVYGGFPCQDLSCAGKGEGLEGKRSGLFYEIVRICKEASPEFIFLENVPAIRTRGAIEVQEALASIGYDCRWTTLSASEVGANHKRERWFCLAHCRGQRFEARKSIFVGSETGQENQGRDKSSLAAKCGGETLANPLRDRLERQREKPFGACKRLKHACDDNWWSVEPGVGRVADGVKCRSHRIKALGNGVVPLQVKEAFEYLMGMLE